MAGNFSLKKFSDIDLNDPFFDSLKADYPVGGKVKPFEVWFPEKAQEGRTALVFDDENGLGAFVCIKDETENIVLIDSTLPKKTRCKITTTNFGRANPRMAWTASSFMPHPRRSKWSVKLP